MGQAQTQTSRAEEEEEKPIIPGTEVYLDAYSFLQTTRYPSMGEYVLPIPATAILQYCDAYGWTGDDRYILIEVLRALDLAYIDHYNTKGKGKASAKRQKKIVS